MRHWRKDDAWLEHAILAAATALSSTTSQSKPTSAPGRRRIRAGLLHFRVEQYVRSAEGSKAEKPPVAEAVAAAGRPSIEPFETQDINRAKQPPVKNAPAA